MKKLIFLLILALYLSSSAEAANFTNLETNLHNKLDKYGEKVGLVFIDCKTQTVISINGDKTFVAASVIKLPIMAAVFKEYEKGMLSFSEQVEVTKDMKLPGSGVLQWLKPNSYTLWNLTRMMISISDNTATYIMADKLGLEKLNDYCRSLDLRSTVIRDKTALVEPPSGEVNVTSPLDMAYLLLKIYYRDGFTENSSKSMLAFMQNQYYRWGICRPLPRSVKVANKTGNLDGVLNDVGIVFTPAGDYILSIFTQGFPKKREARVIINAISAQVYETYQPGKIAAEQKKLKKPVKKKKVIKKVKKVYRKAKRKKR